MINLVFTPPSSSGLGYLVLSQGTGVRVPVGVLFSTGSETPSPFASIAQGHARSRKRSGRGVRAILRFESSRERIRDALTYAAVDADPPDGLSLPLNPEIRDRLDASEPAPVITGHRLVLADNDENSVVTDPVVGLAPERETRAGRRRYSRVPDACRLGRGRAGRFDTRSG